MASALLLFLLESDPLPLPAGWEDLLLGTFGLTVYLLWDSYTMRKERREEREQWKAERDLLEAEAREMTKKALAALDALSRKERP